MNDNKQLNEAYNGINEGLFNLRQDRTNFVSGVDQEYEDKTGYTRAKNPVFEELLAALGNKVTGINYATHEFSVELESGEEANCKFLGLGG